MKTFFINKGPFDLNYIISELKKKTKEDYKNQKVLNISSLSEAKKGELTFFDNMKYLDQLNKTNASFVLINQKNLFYCNNKNLVPIISDQPLIDFILIAKIFYPEANSDDNEINFGKKFSSYLDKHTVIDDSVEIGKNFKAGPNTTIKKNVKIGENVKIGSNCSISNCIIEDNVTINDGTVIGKIGFGFKFIDNKLVFIPHIGCVIIEKSVYIGSNCTIDRGSFSNTVIGSGTMLDNQVHIAHNCKVGSNCFLAGQVGMAGSSQIGNNCMIGGQAGISGHLSIGSNVYIGGGSGVLKNIKNNSKIMGYPATDIKTFLKNKLINDR